MTECQRLADELRRAMDGDAWHGPPLSALLDRADHVTALATPIAAGHSIAEIVAHLGYWQDVVRRRAEGEVISPRTEADWPSVDATEAGWRQLREQLLASHRALVSRVESLGDARLSATVPGRTIPLYVMLHGVVQHAAYHGGQIALLLKAQGAP